MRLFGTWRPGGADIVPIWWPLADELVVGAGLPPLLLLPPLFCALLPLLPVAGETEGLLVDVVVVVVVPELDAVLDEELLVVVLDDEDDDDDAVAVALLDDLPLDASALDD